MVMGAGKDPALLTASLPGSQPQGDGPAGEWVVSQQWISRGVSRAAGAARLARVSLDAIDNPIVTLNAAALKWPPPGVGPLAGRRWRCPQK
jgi:hypothetical protein